MGDNATDNSDLEGLEIYQLFELMQPLEAADPISMIPQGPGWWVLMGLILLLLGLLLGWRYYRRYQNRYRLYAIAEINALGDDYNPLEISAILKRCLLSHTPRTEVAALTGEPWCEYLNARVDNRVTFTDFYLLRKSHNFDRAALKRQAIYWLENYTVAT
ncbi:DUF4381 domain-containing protein [Gilvimarinus chinensis]|uniref:DUF4381 domain-containing protein n=1 Tax=Gilvimarinus chinensis TaxID=396005 RepID=UPI00037C8A23|nr:DUF4381 domain-containing protein [Gilvimarinus chinensis]